MARTRIFRFRLSPAEDQGLGQRAKNAGLTKSDVIRQALGWQLGDPPPPEPGEAAKKAVALADARAKPADPDAEPGAAAMEKIAERIRGKA